MIQLKLKSDVNKGFVDYVNHYLGIGDFSYTKSFNIYDGKN